MSMCGTRDAAQNWASEYAKTLVDAEFARGKAKPRLFRYRNRDISIMVHGAYFGAVGPAKAVAEVGRVQGQKYKLKMETLGDGKDDLKEAHILSKFVSIDNAGVHLEADPRHAERVIKEMGVSDGKVSTVPGSKEESRKQLQATDYGEDPEPEWLEGQEATRYRVVAATLNYLSADSADTHSSA